MNADFAGLLLFAALSSGGLTWFGLACVLPPVHAAGAPLPLLGAVGMLIVSIPVVTALATLGILPSLAFVLLPGLLFIVSIIPSQLARWSGGPGARAAPHGALLERISRAYERFEVGDIDGWRADLEAARGLATPATSNYVDLWLRYAEEEQQRRAGNRISSQPTLAEIRNEAGRLLKGFAPGARLLSALVALAIVVAITPMIAIGMLAPESIAEACDAADRILDDAGQDPASTSTGTEPLPHLVLIDPGEPAILNAEGRLNLEQAGESRHDPTARDQLTASGFVTAYFRDWSTGDGRRLSAEIFEFESRAGAEAFQRSVTAYACRFANEAFRAPHGVGLQVRHGRGDPIVEQVAWVDGSRRILVSRSFATAPEGHALILNLAERAREQLAAPH